MTFDEAREHARAQFTRGEISAATLRRRFGAINAAEGKALAKIARKAHAELTAFYERMERERARADLRRRLMLAVKRYQVTP